MFIIVHHPGYLDTDWQGNERIIPKLNRPTLIYETREEAEREALRLHQRYGTRNSTFLIFEATAQTVQRGWHRANEAGTRDRLVCIEPTTPTI